MVLYAYKRDVYHCVFVHLSLRAMGPPPTRLATFHYVIQLGVRGWVHQGTAQSVNCLSPKSSWNRWKKNPRCLAPKEPTT